MPLIYTLLPSSLMLFRPLSPAGGALATIPRLRRQSCSLEQVPYPKRAINRMYGVLIRHPYSWTAVDVSRRALVLPKNAECASTSSRLVTPFLYVLKPSAYVQGNVPFHCIHDLAPYLTTPLSWTTYRRFATMTRRKYCAEPGGTMKDISS